MTRFKSIYKDSIEALTLALFALVLFIFISLKVRQIGNAIYPISLLANQHIHDLLRGMRTVFIAYVDLTLNKKRRRTSRPTPFPMIHFTGRLFIAVSFCLLNYFYSAVGVVFQLVDADGAQNCPVPTDPDCGRMHTTRRCISR